MESDASCKLAQATAAGILPNHLDVLCPSSAQGFPPIKRGLLSDSQAAVAKTCETSTLPRLSVSSEVSTAVGSRSLSLSSRRSSLGSCNHTSEDTQARERLRQQCQSLCRKTPHDVFDPCLEVGEDNWDLSFATSSRTDNGQPLRQGEIRRLAREMLRAPRHSTEEREIAARLEELIAQPPSPEAPHGLAAKLKELRVPRPPPEAPVSARPSRPPRTARRVSCMNSALRASLPPAQDARIEAYATAIFDLQATFPNDFAAGERCLMTVR